LTEGPQIINSSCLFKNVGRRKTAGQTVRKGDRLTEIGGGPDKSAAGTGTLELNPYKEQASPFTKEKKRYTWEKGRCSRGAFRNEIPSSVVKKCCHLLGRMNGCGGPPNPGPHARGKKNGSRQCIRQKSGTTKFTTALHF